MRKSMLRASLVVPVLIVLGSEGALRAGGNIGSPNRNSPGIIPVKANPFGHSYAEWAVKLWQDLLAIPADGNPVTTGQCYPVGPGPVWFMAAPFGGTMECTIPAGKAIFFPMVAYENDYPCPDPDFQPPPGQSLEEFLTEGARAVIDQVVGLELVIDGVSVDEDLLFEHRVTSPLHTITGDPSLTAVLDPCIIGTPQPAVTDGYWFMLAPLSVGTHRIEVTVVLEGDIVLQTTNIVTVQPR